MAGNGIGVSLQVDGETKFKQAMKTAANAVKDVDSRLKLATAEFKKNGDAQKLMQTRSKTLNEEIKRQTQIVDSLEEALKTTEKQYGENSTQALHYEGQLNSARQKLTEMQTALRNNAQGLDENGRAFESAGEQAEKASLSFSDMSQAISNVQQAAKNAATYVINFAKSAWNAMSNASEYADNLLTLSAQTGLDVEQLQKYAMTAGLVDAEVHAIYTAMARMVNPSGEMAEALAQLGVNTRDIIGTEDFTGAMKNYVKDTDFADTKARNALDIFWDTIDALKALSDQGKNVDELTKSIFGKSFTEMKPLIDKGKAGWEAAGDVLDNVASQDSIEKLGEFNDALQELKAEFTGLQTEVLGQLAPGFTEIAKALTDMLERFGEWAKSPEGQAALKNLSDSIAGILSGLGEEDFESLITTATGIIEKLASAINSITNDPSGIINAVKGALMGYAALTVSKDVLSLLALLRSLGGSGIAGNIGGVFGKLGNLFTSSASAEGAETAAAAASTPGGAAALKGLFAKAWPTVKTLATGFGPYVAAIGAGAGIHNALEGHAIQRDFGSFLDMEESGQLETFVSQASENMYASIASELLKGISMVDEGEGGDALIKTMIENREILSQFIPNLADMIAKEENGTGYAGFEWYQAAHDAIVAMSELKDDPGMDFSTTLVEDFEDLSEGADGVTEAIDDMAAEYEKFAEQWRFIGVPEEEIQQLYESIKEEGALVAEGVGQTGANATASLAAGILSGLPSVSAAVSRINAVVAQISAGPATTVAYGMGRTGANVTRNNSIFINNLNQSNNADVYDVLRGMSDAQDHVTRGYGYVPV